MKRPVCAVLPILALLPLGACASPGDYPSLARREVERMAESPPPAAASESPAAATPGLAERLSALVEQARTAHGKFTGHQARAAALVSAGTGAAIGSEAWAVATVALADLEAARSEAMIALAELDALNAADRTAHYNEPSEDAAPIAAARDRVIAWVGEEDRVLADLRGRLGN